MEWWEKSKGQSGNPIQQQQQAWQTISYIVRPLASLLEKILQHAWWHDLVWQRLWTTDKVVQLGRGSHNKEKYCRTLPQQHELSHRFQWRHCSEINQVKGLNVVTKVNLATSQAFTSVSTMWRTCNRWTPPQEVLIHKNAMMIRSLFSQCMAQFSMIHSSRHATQWD